MRVRLQETLLRQAVRQHRRQTYRAFFVNLAHQRESTSRSIIRGKCSADQRGLASEPMLFEDVRKICLSQSLAFKAQFL
jgi:hypothetical protein